MGRWWHFSRGAALALSSILELLEQACQQARHETDVTHIRTYIAASHCSVKFLSCVSATALVATSILSVTIFGHLLDAFHYFMSAANFFFATIIVLQHAKSSQEALLQMVPGLADLPGRGFLHIYLGSMNIFMLPGMPLDFVYISVGGSLCLCALLMFCHHNYCLQVPDWPGLEPKA